MAVLSPACKGYLSLTLHNKIPEELHKDAREHVCLQLCMPVWMSCSFPWQLPTCCVRGCYFSGAVHCTFFDSFQPNILGNNTSTVLSVSFILFATIPSRLNLTFHSKMYLNLALQSETRCQWLRGTNWWKLQQYLSKNLSNRLDWNDFIFYFFDWNSSYIFVT